jgi:hypothetical protein
LHYICRVFALLRWQCKITTTTRKYDKLKPFRVFPFCIVTFCSDIFSAFLHCCFHTYVTLWRSGCTWTCEHQKTRSRLTKCDTILHNVVYTCVVVLPDFVILDFVVYLCFRIFVSKSGNKLRKLAIVLILLVLINLS